jgi:hypothetical protein
VLRATTALPMSRRILSPGTDRFLPLPFALALMRINTALLFMAHAVVRVVNGSVPRFSDFLAASGFPFPTAIVYAISAVESGAGVSLAMGGGCVRRRPACWRSPRPASC